MAVGNHATTIVLVREMRHWSEALRTARLLRRSGASVALFYLGRVEPLGPHASAKRPRRGGPPCYAAQAAAAAVLGIDCLPLEAMAQRIRDADRVIPV